MAARAWLVTASLLFYAFGKIECFVLFMLSILFNYLIGGYVSDSRSSARYAKGALIAGVTVNLVLLGYYKYTNFFINSANLLFGIKLQALGIVLPLGISFFTFLQIAYIVDSYREKDGSRSFLEYIAFVSFFPYLISGPIVRFSEIVQQLRAQQFGIFQETNVRRGVFLFCIGLFKKVVIADTLAVASFNGFSEIPSLTFVDAWVSSLSYTMQIYFDFSGYTDMAIGSALILNIKLPINFNSPYKARNIQEFWTRWHISLSTFLRDYVYIPLGGSRCGEICTHLNIMITFLLCGLWHGAGWTFVFWGVLHGVGLIFYRQWKNLGIKMPTVLAIFLTFQFINISWIFFRADTFDSALKMLSIMFGFSGLSVGGNLEALCLVMFVIPIVFLTRNSIALMYSVKGSYIISACVFLLTFCCLQMANLINYQDKVSDFLYFNF